MWKTMWSTLFVSVFFGCVLGVNEESTGVVSEEERQGSIRGAAKKERASLEQRTSLSLPQERTYAEEDVAIFKEEILDEVVEEWMNGKGDGSVTEEGGAFGMVTKEAEKGEPVWKEELLEAAHETEELVHECELEKEFYEEDAKNRMFSREGDVYIRALTNLLRKYKKEQGRHDDEIQKIKKEIEKEEENYANKLEVKEYDRNKKNCRELKSRFDRAEEKLADRIEELRQKYELENLRHAEETKRVGISSWMENWEKINNNESWDSIIEGKGYVHGFENWIEATRAERFDSFKLKTNCIADPSGETTTVMLWAFICYLILFVGGL
ncbi:MAG: uncharacterized protein A8A55_1404 [Amphiamblys sp. WSBS2006]|nr:MAG: uncharacterized protein A8A55_1404 [Amphiamblys sp. WSBS2006]